MTTPSRVEPIERATGRAWSQWLAFMERIGATDLDHGQIAAKVAEELVGLVDNPGWWAQGVTVAYEQHSGRRLPGQLADGTFEMSLSRATPMGMQALMDAWSAFAASDQEVLALLASDPRVSGTEKRITWRAKAQDGSSIVVTSEPKKSGGAALVTTQTKLPTLESHAAAKEWWAAVVARFLARG